MLLKGFVLICFCIVLFTSACSEDESATGTLPPKFQLTGTAVGTTTDGTKVDCSMDLFFDLSPANKTRQYKGIYRGVLKRAVQTSDGKGFSFSVDVFASVRASLVLPNIGRIAIPTNGIPESRFYRGLAAFEARMDEQGRGSGTWTCAPLDMTINAYNDQNLSVTGQFVIQPIP